LLDWTRAYIDQATTWRCGSGEYVGFSLRVLAAGSCCTTVASIPNDATDGCLTEAQSPKRS
jgi:hypothetical protein